jgi:hypothetical protein
MCNTIQSPSFYRFAMHWSSSVRVTSRLCQYIGYIASNGKMADECWIEIHLEVAVA